MKRRSTSATKTWTQAPPLKKIRHFNQQTNSMQGKISLNHETWVEYDYGVHPPNLTLKTKNQKDKNQESSKLFLGKYPTLRKIVTEIPKHETHAREMDLYIIWDMEETLLWKNGSFEFST